MMRGHFAAGPVSTAGAAASAFSAAKVAAKTAEAVADSSISWAISCTYGLNSCSRRRDVLFSEADVDGRLDKV